TNNKSKINYIKNNTSDDSDSNTEIDIQINDDTSTDIDSDKDNIIDDKPPVYDGDEPYYCFKRRWDAYIQNKQTKYLYTRILNFLNQLMNTKYTNLLAMKKITLD